MNDKVKVLIDLFLFNGAKDTLEIKVYLSYIELCYFWKYEKFGYAKYEYIFFG